MKDSKPEKKISSLRLVLTLIAFVLAAGIMVLAAVNIRHLTVDNMMKTLRSWLGMEQPTESFHYSGDEALAFADVGNGLLVVNQTGVTLFDEYGDKLAERAAVFEAPTAVSNGSIVGIYEIGGNTLLTIDDKGVDHVYEAENKLISVSVNKGGWFVLCAEEENYKGSVTVLNSQRKAVYKLYSGDGYLLNAVLNDDGTRLAAIKLTADGSRIVEYTLDSEEEKSSVTLTDTVALKCVYGAYGELSVLTDSGYVIIDADGVAKTIYEYGELSLGDFSLDGEGYSVIYCQSYSETKKSCLITIDDFGSLIARLDIAKPVLDVSASGQRIAVLYDDGLMVYDKAFGLQGGRYDTETDAAGVIMLPNGRSIVTGEYSAQVY